MIFSFEYFSFSTWCKYICLVDPVTCIRSCWSQIPVKSITVIKLILQTSDEQATDMMFRLVEQMADKEGVTEQLKVESPMLWVGRMNEIQARAREIIYSELIYT